MRNIKQFQHFRIYPRLLSTNAYIIETSKNFNYITNYSSLSALTCFLFSSKLT